MASEPKEVVQSLLKERKEIIMPTFAGLIFFLLFDGAIGGFLSLFTTKVEPFYITKTTLKLTGLNKLEKFHLGNLYLSLIGLLVLWSIGRMTQIISQQFFLDRIKGNYTEVINEKADKSIKAFRLLREIVSEDLKRRYPILKDLGFNDYLLYQFLASKELQLEVPSSKTKDAAGIAFIGLTVIGALLLSGSAYALLLTQEEGINKCIGAGVFLTTLFLSFLLKEYFTRLIASRFISRNIKLYINYVLKNKGQGQ